MKDVGWVVHTILEGSIEMRKCFSTAAETHTLAEVISTLFAVITMITHDTGFDCDSLAWYKIFDSGAHSGYYSSCFVTQHERGLKGVFAVPTMQVVMYYMIVG
jgi:hypothetical protein